MGWLSKLPVKSFCPIDDDVGVVYLAQRKAVTSLEELKDFVFRWYALWDEDDEKDKVEVGDITPEVFSEFQRLQNNNADADPENVDQSIATRILLPKRLLHAHMAAHQYIVPFNVALIQLYVEDDEDRRKAF